MIDTPKATQGGFILYSTSGSPAVLCAPAITALTALTLTGDAYDDGVVRIAIAGTGFTMTTLTKNTTSKGTFAVTAASAGDAANGIEPGTVTFLFHVYIYGFEQCTLGGHFYEFQVGDEVDMALTPAVHSAFRGVGRINSGESLQSVETLLPAVGDDPPSGTFDSGLSVIPMIDDGNELAERLTGTCVRPGVYCFWIFCHCAYENYPGADAYPDGDSYVPVIVSIRMPDYSAGKLVLILDGNYADTAGRLAVTSHKIGNYSCEHLAGDFTGLTRSHSILHTSYSDVSEFYFELVDGTWRLLARRYLTDAGAPPSYAVVATAPDVRFNGNASTVPPKSGWTGGVIVTGDTRYWVPEQGFFDWAGTDPVLGDYYQQQTNYNRQFAGYDRPAEYKFSVGKYLYQSVGGVWRLAASGTPAETDAVVVPQTMSGIAIPYSPPRLGDLAIDNFNVNRNSDLRIINGEYALGLFYRYIYKRQIPLPDGITSAVRYATVSSSTSSSSHNHTESIEVARYSEYTDREKYASIVDDISENNASGSASITMACPRNVDDMLEMLVGSGTLSASASNTSSHVSNAVHSTHYQGVEREQDRWQDSDIRVAGGSISGSAHAAIFFASGPHMDGYEHIYSTANAHGSAVGTFTGTRNLKQDIWGWTNGNPSVYVHDDAHSTNITEPYSSSGGVSLEFQGWGVGACSLNGFAQHRKKTWSKSAYFKEVHREFDADANVVVDTVVEKTASFTRTQFTTNGVVMYNLGTTNYVDPAGVTHVIDDPEGDSYAAITGAMAGYTPVEDTWNVGSAAVIYNWSESETTQTIS